MPPRHAYWTILVDEQPTAFRAALLEDLQPTFKRLKEKHPSARVVWFQNGKVWDSRLDAQEAMRARGEMGRRGDARQASGEGGGGGFRDRTREPRPEQADRRDSSGKLEWKPKGTFVKPEAEGRPVRRSAPREGGPVHRSAQREGGKPEWKPKGKFPAEGRPIRRSAPREGGGSAEREGGKLDWKPKGKVSGEGRPIRRDAPREGGRSAEREGGKLEWKPKGAAAAPRGGGPRFEKPDWKPRGTSSDRPPKRPWSPKGPRAATPRSGEKLAWRPKSKAQDEKKREWIPKEEYKKSLGSKPQARDKKWRPGGEHRDPRQKYKDAKKAKWTRFKQNVRKRWEAKQPGKKKDDE